MDSRRIYRRERLGLFYFLRLPEKSRIDCSVVSLGDGIVNEF